MDLLILPINASQLRLALLRYFKYIVSVIPVHEQNDIVEGDTIDNVLYLKEAKKDTDLLRLYKLHSTANYISMGYDSDAAINLFEFDSLKAQFTKALTSKDAPTPLYKYAELIKLVSQLFTSHGKQSILQGLTNTIYYLKNGLLLFKKGGIEWVEASQQFIVPGTKWWERFNHRYKKYSEYLGLLVDTNVLSQLDSEINRFSDFMENIKSAESAQIETLSETFIQLNLDRLEEIYIKICKLADILGIPIK